MPGPVQFGRIVWVEMADAHGIRKLRPAAVQPTACTAHEAQTQQVHSQGEYALLRPLWCKTIANVLSVWADGLHAEANLRLLGA